MCLQTHTKKETQLERSTSPFVNWLLSFVEVSMACHLWRRKKSTWPHYNTMKKRFLALSWALLSYSKHQNPRASLRCHLLAPCHRTIFPQFVSMQRMFPSSAPIPNPHWKLQTLKTCLSDVTTSKSPPNSLLLQSHVPAWCLSPSALWQYRVGICPSLKKGRFGCSLNPFQKWLSNVRTDTQEFRTQMVLMKLLIQI